MSLVISGASQAYSMMRVSDVTSNTSQNNQALLDLASTGQYNNMTSVQSAENTLNSNNSQNELFYKIAGIREGVEREHQNKEIEKKYTLDFNA